VTFNNFLCDSTVKENACSMTEPKNSQNCRKKTLGQSKINILLTKTMKSPFCHQKQVLSKVKGPARIVRVTNPLSTVLQLFL